MSFGLTRTVVRGLIPILLNEGLSADRALKLLISEGLGYRRKTFLDDWREFKGVAKKAGAWKYTPRKFKLSPENFVPTEKNIGAPFQYIFDVDLFDSDNNFTYPAKYSFTSTKHLSRQQAELQMLSILEQDQTELDSSQGLEVVSVLLDVPLVRRDYVF